MDKRVNSNLLIECSVYQEGSSDKCVSKAGLKDEISVEQQETWVEK
jgi:hypothetical protein